MPLWGNSQNFCPEVLWSTDALLPEATKPIAVLQQVVHLPVKVLSIGTE